MTVQDIITRVQSELEDATGEANSDWTDADYILTKLPTASDDISIRLQLLDLNYSTIEIILPNIAANTVDLSAAQAAGQPLAQMMLPKSVEWRLVGQTQEDWEPVQQVDKIIDTDRGTGEAGAPVTSDDPTVESWEWRGGILKLSPCMVPIDLRVRFVGTSISLANNSQQQIIGLTNIYVYKVCEKICFSRASGTNTLSTGFAAMYERSCADFEGLSIKTQQSKRIRFGGRRSGGDGGGWDGGWRPPIVG